MSNEAPCPTCGGRNPAHTEFCNLCGAYLGWDSAQPAAGQQNHPLADNDATRVVSTAVQEPASVSSADVVQEIRVELEVGQVEVIPGGTPARVGVHITNESTVVEAYRVTVLQPPDWLIVTPGQVQLLPGTDERVEVGLAIAAENLVPVQRFRLLVRVQAESSSVLVSDLLVDVAIGAVTAPAQIRLEPSTVRARDTATATFRVLIDNRRSNVPLTIDLTGRDAESLAIFTFQPTHLLVPPGGTAIAALRVDAPPPPPGETVNRQLTVAAAVGGQELTATAEFAQATSAEAVDPPMQLRLDPAVVHAHRDVGIARILVDNRRGTRPQRVRIEARDQEGAVAFVINPPVVDVGARSWAEARVSMRAPRPEPGEQVTRSIVVTALNGRDSVEAQGQLVQARSAHRPFLRVLLTLVGSVAMILGSWLPWSLQPELSGMGWNYPNLPRQLGVATQPVDAALQSFGVFDLVTAAVSVGGLVMILGLIAALGIGQTSGKVIRGAAGLGVVVLLLFLAAIVTSDFVGRGFPGLNGGWLLTLVGGALAFVGSFFAKP